jgi:pimeloyl-ACP methyl ester carboxylesterase
VARAQDRIDSFMDQWREQRESVDPAAWEPATLAASPRAGVTLPDSMPAQVAQWRVRGRIVPLCGEELFVVDQGPRDAPVVTMLHGFPGSSWDFSWLSALTCGRLRTVTFDFPGYGMSTKPAAGDYSLARMADITEALLSHLGVSACTLYGHDIGSTLVAELLMRQREGRLSFTPTRVFVTDGTIFMDKGRFAPGLLALLSLPDEPLTEPLRVEQFLPQIRRLFAPEHPLRPDDEIALLWLLRFRQGDRLVPRLVRYVDERRAQQDRWTQGLTSFAGPMTVLWGEQDPSAVVAMARHLGAIRPATEVITWPDVAHWPHYEVPQRVANHILDRVTPDRVTAHT